MGIWIRSQDKKIIMDCATIYIGESMSKYVIWGMREDSDQSLGVYPAESEALLVLDMIQDKISGFAFVQLAGPDKFTGYVGNIFQMPDAGFSEEGK